MRQYYYRNPKCDAGNPHIDCCICWWDEGTGPLAGTNKEPEAWREKPASLEKQLAQAKEWCRVLQCERDEARAIGQELADISAHCLDWHIDVAGNFKSDHILGLSRKITDALQRWAKLKEAMK
jgi:hypothetical protein